MMVLYKIFIFCLFLIFLYILHFLSFFFFPVSPLRSDHLACQLRTHHIGYRAAIVTVINEGSERYSEFAKRLGSSITRHVGVRNVDRFLYILNLTSSFHSPFITNLQKAGWEYIHHLNNMDPYFSKFIAWNMTQYDLVLLLDADTMVVDDISPLFTLWGPRLMKSKYLFAAALDQPQLWTFRFQSIAGNRFNSGVMLLRPNTNTFEWLMDSIGRIPYDGLKDQTILNAGMRSQHMWLDSEYNTMIVVAYAVPWSWPDRPRIIHFTFPKPDTGYEDCRVTSAESLCTMWRNAPIVGCIV